MTDKLVRIYSGTEVTVNLLKEILEEAEITGLIQDDFQSGIMAGFSGGTPSAVDLFIQETDLKKAEQIVEEFRSGNK